VQETEKPVVWGMPPLDGFFATSKKDHRSSDTRSFAISLFDAQKG